jgi:hypothetical protein
MQPARGTVVIHLTAEARSEMRQHEVLVFDWHRVAICCACAGEVSLHCAPRSTVERKATYRPLPSNGAGRVFAHRMALPHLARRDVTVDCRRTFGLRRFHSDLPPDFGLRAVLGRADGQTQGGTS